MVLCMFFHIVQNVKKINKNRTDHYECVVLYMHQVDLVYAFLCLFLPVKAPPRRKGKTILSDFYFMFKKLSLDKTILNIITCPQIFD